MSKQSIVTGYRLAFAALGLVAMAVQLVEVWDKPNNPLNFFSFFTIESNILTVAVLLYGVARPGLSGRSHTLDLVRGAAVLYMMFTFIVYGVLLAGYQEELQTTIPWVDTVVHRIMPIVIFLDWIIDPPDNRLSWREAYPRWILFPVLYGVYSWIRGPIVDWYPYPFLDPGQPGGVAAIVAYSLAFTVVVGLGTWLIVWVGHRLRLALAPDPARASASASAPAT